MELERSKKYFVKLSAEEAKTLWTMIGICAIALLIYIAGATLEYRAGISTLLGAIAGILGYTGSVRIGDLVTSVCREIDRQSLAASQKKKRGG